MSLLPPCVCRLGALCDIGVERIGAFATLAGALQDYVSERPILQCEIGIRPGGGMYSLDCCECRGVYSVP